MIYTVECSFSDPACEAEWNAFYNRKKLPALISVVGFHTSQRFKALSSGCPVYLAVHTIDGLHVLSGEEYRQKGGGNFAHWQPHVTDWHRNLYDHFGLAPAIGEEELLALCSTGPEPLVQMGLAPMRMQAVALEKCPKRRWLAKLPRNSVQSIEMPESVALYSPMTEQLTSARKALTQPQL